jgi:hypothetical protein
MIVVAASPEGEREILSYNLSMHPTELQAGRHVATAMTKAVQAGYIPLTAFDIQEPAGQQLLGKAKLKGDSDCFAVELGLATQT